jgi:hypothetical protein
LHLQVHVQSVNESISAIVSGAPASSRGFPLTAICDTVSPQLDDSGLPTSRDA